MKPFVCTRCRTQYDHDPWKCVRCKEYAILPSDRVKFAGLTLEQARDLLSTRDCNRRGIK